MAIDPLQPAPRSLVDAWGDVRIGVFDAPLRDVGLERARLRAAGLPLPGASVRFRLKEWQHYAFVLPDLFVGLAVVHAKFLVSSWCHVVDRGTGEAFEHHRQGPDLDVRIAPTLWDDTTHLHAPDYRVDIRNHLDDGRHRVRLRMSATRGRPAVSADLQIHHDLGRHQPLVVCLPVGPNRGMYSHKVALPVEGTLRVGDRLHVADLTRCAAILDIHKAHYPHHTWWRWATGVGPGPDGDTFAFNLTRNLNRDDARYNENGIWKNGALRRVGRARFFFDPEHVLEPWRLRSECGAVDLEFTPQGERAEHLDLGLVRAAFHQPYGRMSFSAPRRWHLESLATSTGGSIARPRSVQKYKARGNAASRWGHPAMRPTAMTASILGILPSAQWVVVTSTAPRGGAVSTAQTAASSAGPNAPTALPAPTGLSARTSPARTDGTSRSAPACHGSVLASLLASLRASLRAGIYTAPLRLSG
jgi:hypothetical protein